MGNVAVECCVVEKHYITPEVSSDIIDYKFSNNLQLSCNCTMFNATVKFTIAMKFVALLEIMWQMGGGW